MMPRKRIPAVSPPVRRESSAAVYSWRAPDAPPSRMPATYEISVIELPLFSCHGCSDASLLPALGRTFYPPRRVHHSTGSTIAAGEVCRTSHNLRPPRRRLVPVGHGSALPAREISRLSDDFGRGFARNCVPAAPGAGRRPPRPGWHGHRTRLNAGPGPTPRGAARRPPRPRRRQGPAPW
jgi:hypothetical protein